MTDILRPPTRPPHEQLVELYRNGQYRRALPLAAQACEQARATGGGSLDVTRSLDLLADLERALAHYDDAERHYLDALAIWRGAPGNNWSDFARSLHGLACLYERTGDYPQAQRL